MIETSDVALVITRTFDAAPEQVFDAWLTREQWQAWIGPEGVDSDVPLMEPRVGGRYRVEMHMPNGDIITTVGVFETIDRARTLKFTWGADGDPSRQSLVTLTFSKKGAKTELTLRQEGLPGASSRDAHSRGWNSTLNKLERHLKKDVR